jgi:uncharacterized SAM-dependent methyltransferase
MARNLFADALQHMLRAPGQPRPWSLQLVASDAERQLQDLVADLTRPASRTGEGKRIRSGFSYWGSEPTFAWARSCTDPLYPVARESIESFTRGWAELQSHLDGQRYHYVSFGPGTGEKDAAIITDLMRHHPDLYYVPVDISAEMLRLAVCGPIRATGLPSDRIMPLQLDFANQSHLAALTSAIEYVLGAEPVLFSLLGNTLANFDDDVALLRTLTAGVRPQDRFVLEAATTDRVEARTADAAASEYRRSRSFREFATSALLRHTDLHIDDMEQLAFIGGVEEDRALSVRVVFQNDSDRPVRFTLLANRTSVTLPPGDTIRVLLTRKYVATGLKTILADCALTELAATHHDFVGDLAGPRFGMSLIVVSARGSEPGHGSTSVDDIWG